MSVDKQTIRNTLSKDKKLLSIVGAVLKAQNDSARKNVEQNAQRLFTNLA